MTAPTDAELAREIVVGKASQEAVVRALLGLSPTHDLGTIFPDDMSHARRTADAILAALGGHG